MLRYFKTSLIIISFCMINHLVYANGVVVVDASTQTYFQLDSSVVVTEVENEVAITTVRNVFTNTTGTDTTIVFAYPIKYAASATGIRWTVDGNWQVATIISQASVDTLPASGPIAGNLKSYLGYAPFYFAIPDTVAANGSLSVEFTYVELLPYSFGYVTYEFINDYRLIQTDTLAYQSLDYTMSAVRGIDTLGVLSTHVMTSLGYDNSTGSMTYAADSVTAAENYQILYRLTPDQTGAFTHSTFLNPADIPDSDPGFFSMEIEPGYYDTVNAMPKNFTLVIDRSGSMSGQKIEDAKMAASYIVANLDSTDHFNVIDLSDGIGQFRTGLAPYTANNKMAALQYIANLDGRGGTNISGAFDVAIPQYAAVNDSDANIIMFFSDGLPTSGITDRQPLLNSIQTLIDSTGKTICIYTLAIGSDVDWQFCTTLSMTHNGFVQYVNPSSIYLTAVSFYWGVRHPVLISPEITVSPESAFTELYPTITPNFFWGRQVIFSGRYTTPGPVTISITGTAFGVEHTQEFTANLSGTAQTQNQFLMKIWAKQKIESLLFDYFMSGDDIVAAQAIREQVGWLSVNYGVVSPFTSLSIPPDFYLSIGDQPEPADAVMAADFELLGNYPNPYNASTTIQFKIIQNLSDVLSVKIYNTMGQLVRVLTLQVNHSGTYSLMWDGLTSSGLAAPSGSYIYTVSFGNTVLAGRMSMIK